MTVWLKVLYRLQPELDAVLTPVGIHLDRPSAMAAGMSVSPASGANLVGVGAGAANFHGGSRHGPIDTPRHPSGRRCSHICRSTDAFHRTNSRSRF